jgi:hypothetical protein
MRVLRLGCNGEPLGTASISIFQEAVTGAPQPVSFEILGSENKERSREVVERRCV